MISNYVDRIEGINEFKNNLYTDIRGDFTRFVDLNTFNNDFKPTYFAKSTNKVKHTMRGLHFQSYPSAEAKSVTCIKGSIFEVFLDLRRGFSTFGKWTHIINSPLKNTTIYIPKGIAHGYQTLEDDTWVIYGIDADYNPAKNFRIDCFDNYLNIQWPNSKALISNQDANGISWDEFVSLNLTF